jgi:hypothetical protein
MEVRMRQVDLGVCAGRTYEVGGDRWAIILPGANYLPDAPLLWFAREAALSARRNVVVAWDTFDRQTDPVVWVEDRLSACLARATGDDHPLLVAKSLTTLAAGSVAERGLRAIWLTPLVSDLDPLAPRVRSGLARASAPALLIGGTADPAWDAAFVRSVTQAQVLEIPDGDHALRVADDLDRSLAALTNVTRAMARFAAE